MKSILLVVLLYAKQASHFLFMELIVKQAPTCVSVDSRSKNLLTRAGNHAAELHVD